MIYPPTVSFESLSACLSFNGIIPRQRKKLGWLLLPIGGDVPTKNIQRSINWFQNVRFLPKAEIRVYSSLITSNKSAGIFVGIVKFEKNVDYSVETVTGYNSISVAKILNVCFVPEAEIQSGAIW